jgi:hypothetical protein
MTGWSPKVMLANGYKPDSGLGQNLQGRTDIVQLPEKRDNYGLGYKPDEEFAPPQWQKVKAVEAKPPFQKSL